MSRSKSGIAYPGCHFEGRVSQPPFSKKDKIKPPVIIWNHRWEFDKNPEGFFRALQIADTMGLAFDLVLLGERYRRVPKVFRWALKHFKCHIIHSGYDENKLQYKEWLKRGSSVVSTARQENFGISVIEAIRYGCLPLLPNRLVYPEIIPKKFHNRVLYANLRDLVEKLVAELRRSDQENENLRKELSSAMAHFAWQRCIDVYDKELDGLANVKSNR